MKMIEDCFCHELAQPLQIFCHYLKDEPPMQITQACEYAIRTMLHLSGLPDGTTANVSTISNEWEIPETFLRKIVSSLSKAGLITTQRGVGGGLQLSRNPENITLLDVIEAIEGPISLNKCLMAEQVCPRDGWCPVHTVWMEAQQKLREHLSSRTLASLSAEAGTRKRIFDDVISRNLTPNSI
jgi:Rrf2 family transcriptional regulator, iron-sulfur cluster assembly transcription factor